jgi:hypothetical protein
MSKPRLTRAVIEGLRYVIADAQTMLEERQGWGEEGAQDGLEEAALLYLGQLIKWAEARWCRTIGC